MKRIVLLLVFASGPFAFGPSMHAAQTDVHPEDSVVIDARAVPPRPTTLPFPVGGVSPDGHRLSANSRYLIKDGRPWFPIVGEFHYSRYPDAEWEQEILKMQAVGIQVVSTYVFWIHHEEIEGQFDWSQQRNLRRFVELCAQHGMPVWIRIGPWAHGEARNGGLPDWLLQKAATRANDPTYLNYVTRFFGAIGEQLRGLFWKDGGPIIGVQLENEYSARGPGKGAEHILRLRQIARKAGLDAPFYTVTGWDGAVIPSRDVLPVFSGYADGFWWRTLDELPPNPNYFFTKIRCQENVAENLRSRHPEIDTLASKYPFLTAEMGGGMAVAYHRRPHLTADDTAAMELVKLGSGVTMYGYYMFHGGTNPEGKKTSLQESQATGYPNDLSVKSYDFQAPLGEFGQSHPSFGLLKLFHLFLSDFGSELAPMVPYFPAKVPTSLHDASTPRVVARLQGDHGYIFINNYQRNYPLPEHKNFQVHLKLPAEPIDVPRRPLTIPSGAYTFWPVNLSLGQSVLRYATAQLLCRLDNPNTYVFFALPGVPAEFAFQEENGETIEAPGARVERQSGIAYVDVTNPGTEPAIRLRTRKGGAIDVVVLTREQATNLWKLPVAGKQRLVLSAAQIHVDGDKLVLLSSDASELRAGLFPTLKATGSRFRDFGSDGIFHVLSARVEPVNLTLRISKLSEPGADPPLRMGKEVLLAPDESAFDSAAKWKIEAADARSDAIAEVLLKITYQGDVARMYAGDKLLTDNFYNGQPWVIGLRGIPAPLKESLELVILPLHAQAPIYLPSGARPTIPDGAQLADLESVDLVPIYRAVMDGFWWPDMSIPVQMEDTP